MSSSVVQRKRSFDTALLSLQARQNSMHAHRQTIPVAAFDAFSTRKTAPKTPTSPAASSVLTTTTTIASSPTTPTTTTTHTVLRKSENIPLATQGSSSKRSCFSSHVQARTASLFSHRRESKFAKDAEAEIRAALFTDDVVMPRAMEKQRQRRRKRKIRASRILRDSKQQAIPTTATTPTTTNSSTSSSTSSSSSSNMIATFQESMSLGHISKKAKLFHSNCDEAELGLSFTPKQVRKVVLQAVTELEKKLRADYDATLTELLQQQFEAFTQFNHDYLSNKARKERPSYIS